jgi:hypothetical protein
MSASEIVVYQSDDGSLRVECRFEDQRVWLTQAQMATLFQTTPQNITQHLRTIYAEGELQQSATCKEGLQVRTDGKLEVSREIEHDALPVVLAVGYRVRSPRGAQLRQWATALLGEYLLKGFVMDDARLRAPDRGGVPDDFGKHRPDLRFGPRPAAQRRWLHLALPEPRDTNLPSVAALETALSRGLPLHGGAL